MKFTGPRSITIQDPGMYHDGSRPGRGVPGQTELFRTRENLPEALGEAMAGVIDGETIKIVSAGCSIGAEVDSLLALGEKNIPEHSMRVIGLDRSDRFLRRAKRGKYFLPITRDMLNNPDSAEEVEETLAEWGFATDFGRVLWPRGLHGRFGYYRVDSRPLREGRDVSFKKTDLRREIPVEKPNLVTANNVLYHLTPEDATRVIDNIAKTLASNGVMSIGDAAIRPMGYKLTKGKVPADKDKVMYVDWLVGAIERLETKHRLTPIHPDDLNLPTMFVKG